MKLLTGLEVHQSSLVASLLWWEQGVLNSQSNSEGCKPPLESSEQNIRESHSTSKATRVSPSLVTANRKRKNNKQSQKQNTIPAVKTVGVHTDRAHGSLRPLAANLFCVNSSGVPSTFHCRQSGMEIFPWPWSPPMLIPNIDKCKSTLNLIQR